MSLKGLHGHRAAMASFHNGNCVAEEWFLDLPGKGDLWLLVWRADSAVLIASTEFGRNRQPDLVSHLPVYEMRLLRDSTLCLNLAVSGRWRRSTCLKGDFGGNGFRQVDVVG